MEFNPDIHEGLASKIKLIILMRPEEVPARARDKIQYLIREKKKGWICMRKKTIIESACAFCNGKALVTATL
jgi:hypothetical protein